MFAVMDPNVELERKSSNTESAYLLPMLENLLAGKSESNRLCGRDYAVLRLSLIHVPDTDV